MQTRLFIRLFQYLVVSLIPILFATAAYSDSREITNADGDCCCCQAPPQFLLKARELDASGRWHEAVEILTAKIAKAPYTWPSAVSAGWTDAWQAYHLLGDILLREEPEKAEGYLYSGIAKAIEEDYAGAESSFTKGAVLDPKSADLQFAIGWAVIRQDRAGDSFKKKPESIRRALPHFEAALKIYSTHKMSLLTAGYANTQLAESINSQKGHTPASKKEITPYLEQAIYYFEEYVKSYGENVRLLTDLYDLCAQTGKWDRAAGYLNEAIKLSRENSGTRKYLEFHLRHLKSREAEELKRSNGIG